MTRMLSVILRLAVPPAAGPDGAAAARFAAYTADVALPLIARLRSGELPRLTVVVTPVLAEMWGDPALRKAVEAAVDGPMAALYRALDGDPCRALAELQAQGAIELMTAPATDAVLPILGDRAAARPQIEVAVATHRRRFGAAPAGIDLSRGYSPRLDLLCADADLRWCLVGAGTFDRATARPVRGLRAPLLCPRSGVAAFAVDETAAWIAPPAGDAFAARVDRLGPAVAEWVAGRAKDLDGSTPAHQTVLMPVDADTPAVLDGLAEAGLTVDSPTAWLAAHPVNQVAWPGLGRAGAQVGFGALTDDPDQEWLLRRLPAAARAMQALADRFDGTNAEARRPAEQAARALLMAQCGDWPLMAADGRGAEAAAAVKRHLAAFEALAGGADAAAPTALFSDVELKPFASW